MADEDIFGEYGLPDEPQGDSDWAKARRAVKAEREAKAAEQERANTAERALAFAKAGVPLTDPRTDYFMAGYKGEATTEAIQAAWQQVFGGQPAPQAAPPAPDGQQQQPPATPPADGQQQPPQGLQPFPTAAEIAQQQMMTEVAAQQRIAAAGAGATPVPMDANGAIIDAYRAGGVESMLSTLQNMGIPVADDGVVR